MKKIITLIIAAAMLLSCTVIANAAAAIPEDFDFYVPDGMQRVFATSSYAPDFKTDTAPVFDHRTGTGCTFDLTEMKTVTVHIGSRDCEKVEKFAWMLADDASVKVSFAATNDTELKEWTYFEFEAEQDGKWNVATVKGIKEGYAFYRIDIEAKDAEAVTVLELALFRTEGAGTPAKAGTLLEREMWRVSQAITGKGFFTRFGR